MRMHIELDDELVAQVDELAGPRGRSDFVRDALRCAVELHSRRRSLEAAAGSISNHRHEWDDDPAGWVRAQRGGDDRRVG